MTDDASAVLEGMISVQAALESNSRTVFRILVADGVAGGAARLRAEARRRGIEVRRPWPGELERLATGHTHGGVLAVVGPRRYQPLAELLAAPVPFLVMLDGVEDPYQLGQSIRALYAAGADGLLLPPRNLDGVAGVVARSSAGASERIPTAIVEDLAATVAILRERGVRIVCAQRRRATPVDAADLAGPLLLVVGGSRRGIRRDLAEHADQAVWLPYGRGFGAALDTTSATAALAFEVCRQRRAAAR